MNYQNELILNKPHIDRKEVVLHSLFWLCWIVSFTFIQTISSENHAWFVWLMYYVITLPIFVTHTYLIAYYLLPHTSFKGQYFVFVIGVLLLLMVFSVIELIVSQHLVFKVFDNSLAFEPGYLNFKNIIISGIGNHYIILVFLAIKVGGSWYRIENQKEELLRTKAETDLEIYHYQLQPKLVLTLMEELESLTNKKPDKAPEMIIKISNFLNSFLFEGKEELIPLHLEVKLIEQFLEIHKEALGERITSNFIVSGNLKPHVVPPLLLLPFINSSIKVAYECNNSYEITVLIKAERKYLLFSFSFWSEQEFKLADHKNTEITQKRLMYSFPGKHRTIENTDENFREFSIEIFS